MGKRSPGFERKPRDFYPTPYEAVLPLLPHLPAHSRFAEPCVGDGSLVRHLERNGHNCSWGSDIEDRSQATHIYGCEIVKRYTVADALTLTTPLQRAGLIITNPPWDRDILHPMIMHFIDQAPTFLLFDADWMHTVQAEPYLKFCTHIISVGRVKWIADSKHTGKDNACWYRFSNDAVATNFFGRVKSSSPKP